jgi:hypothetical protein
MTKAEPDKTTDWLAVLRPADWRPADLKPLPYIKGPEHFPHVLKAFGPLSPPDFKRAVIAIDEIVTGYLSVRSRKPPPTKFEEGDKLLASIETSFAKSLAAWERAAPLHDAMLTALIITTAPERRQSSIGRKTIPVAPLLKNALLAVKALRDPNVYRDATGQPSQKKPEREFIWEPLFAALSQFGLRAPFKEHQPLMTTVKELHLVIGIDPPDANAFKQAIRAWSRLRVNLPS